MTSQVFYRKWRPQTLAEVAGQDHVTRTLLHALESGRVAHAYLFCGPRGTGKTSMGRILAKAVSCLNNGRGEPCNTCEMCQAVTQGRALDVIEIDAASNRGIDDIRELREKVNFSPNVSRYKVYIIDEVHMLTDAASNALLKTLEEPPPHAIFILATTEPHKMLATILSRCQRFDFHRLSHSAVISKLTYICDREGLTVEPQVLQLIAKSVSGSLRDAENVLQQMVAYYGNRIDVRQAEEVLGITSDFQVKELAEHIAGKNIAAGLTTINTMASNGINLSHFNKSLVEYLRNMLLVKAGAEDSLDLVEDDIIQLKELTGRISTEYILKALKLFSQVDFRSREYSSLPMDMALVECALDQEEETPVREKTPAPVSRKASPDKAGTVAVNIPKPQAMAPAAPEKAAKPEVAARAPAEKTAEPAPEAATIAEKAPPPETDFKKVAEPASGSGIEYVSANWSDFVDTMRGIGSAGNLDAFLRSSCEPVDVEGDTLVLAFYYPFHKKKIEDPKYCGMIERKLRERFGSPNKIRCILSPKGKQRAVDGHLVKAALEMGGRITGVVEGSTSTKES